MNTNASLFRYLNLFLLVSFLIFSPNLYGQIISAPTIASGSGQCGGQQINIGFSTSTTFSTGNVFTIQLSDSVGGFANPKVLGTRASSVAGTVQCTIPVSIVGKSSQFKIRVVGSAPAVIGTSLNSVFLQGLTIDINSIEGACKGSVVHFIKSFGDCFFPPNTIFTFKLERVSGGTLTVVQGDLNVSSKSGYFTVPTGQSESNYKLVISASSVPNRVWKSNQFEITPVNLHIQFPQNIGCTGVPIPARIDSHCYLNYQSQVGFDIYEAVNPLTPWS